MTWKQRYDRLKFNYNWTDKDLAEITGYEPSSIRSVVNSKIHNFPRWLKLAIVIFEMENKDKLEGPM